MSDRELRPAPCSVCGKPGTSVGDRPALCGDLHCATVAANRSRDVGVAPTPEPAPEREDGR